MKPMALRRGITFPNALSYRARLSSVRIMLLQGAGEEEFSRWVKDRAHQYGWRGWHLRDSEGVIESIHTLRADGFCDGLGLPDWEFWHEDLEQRFKAELKGADGELGKYQKPNIASQRRAGEIVFVWYPKDAETIERIFHFGYRQEDIPA